MKKKGNQNRANQMNPNNPAYYQSRGMMSGAPRQNAKQSQNTSNQMNPNNPAYYQSRGIATVGSCQNKNPSQNRSNQMNPNNPAYHQCRGNSSRPKDWESILQKSKANGLLEHRANTAGAMSSEKRRAIGGDTKRVEKVVKEQLGGDVRVYRGGSQKKGVNIGKSDLDLKMKVSKPMTLDDRAKLGQGLKKEFGEKNVDSSHPKIHIVKGKAVNIDIVPSQAEYFPPDFKLDKLGVRPFATNKKGRHAVRNLKERYQNAPGIKIEKVVLGVQQRNKGISLDDIIREAGAELRIL